MIPFLSGPIRSFGLCVLGCALVYGQGEWLYAQSTSGASAGPKAELSTAELIERLGGSQGPSRTELQLALLKRLDAPLDARDRACDELLERYRDADDPLILGAAYAGKGKVYGDRLDFPAAVKMLELAERYGRRCAEADPGIFFKATCNRAVYLSALGQRDEPTRILREAIEYARPYGDQLDVPFAYAMLGRLAEASGAVDKAFEYLQTAFEMATRLQKATLAAQAGISILELALAEEKPKLAEEWLERIEPWIEKSNDPRTKFALTLRRQDIERALGDPKLAALAVQKIIDSRPVDGDAQGMGLLYLSLAASDFKAQDYEAALVAAERAAELLKPVVRSWTLTQLIRMESLHVLGKSTEALEAVNSLLGDDRVVTLHRIQLLELQSRILASLERHSESLAALQACRDEESKHASERAHEVAQFIKAAYDGQQREAELTAAKARQQAAEVQAELNHEVALRERTSATHDRFMKNGAIVGSLLMLVVGLLFIRTYSNRQAALTIARRERELNEQLQLRLEQQAIELKEETAARQQLELAVERKFRDEALGKLTGGVAHDFNNLLTVILHSIDLLRMQNPQLAKDSLQLLEAVSGAAESGASIVSQLMAYTRQQPLEPQPIRISAWLTNTRTILRQTIGKPIEFIENDHTDGASICIDTAQLTTAVINLLANARDAIGPGSGTIELSIECVDLKESTTQAWSSLPPGRYARFRVLDTGKGMSPEELEHACEPFFTTKSPGAGTGLGLSTVLGFVKQSGGDLQLTSRQGLGTTVSFLLPLTQRQSQQPVAVEPLVAKDQHNQLLLVEDQEAVRMVLAAGLKTIGYEVTQAGHAEEAMAIINKSGAPRILLSDVRMPGTMNGVELRRWVLDRFPEVHVVLMSGYRDLEPHTGTETDIVFLQKPVKLQELHRALSSHS